MEQLDQTFKDIIDQTQAKPSGDGGQYSGICPAHHDKAPSLSISIKEGRILLHCHAGCGTNQILLTLGIKLQDLFETSSVGNPAIQYEHGEESKTVEARSRANQIWEQSSEAPDDHPYLLSKKVQHHGLKVSKGKLVVPLYDQDRILQSLQFISPGGDKKFLSGGRTGGCYYPLGGVPDKILYVAEGFATAATVQETTGCSVAVAFNAGNLKPVAIALREKFPNLEMVICADDDYRTDGNPGMTKAVEAAKASRSKISLPEFDENLRDGDTDFNDLYNLGGAETVLGCIKNSFEPEELESQQSSTRLRQVIEMVRNGDLGAHIE